MPVEEIITAIRKQEEIINEAQKTKESLYQKLLNSGTEDFDLISVKEASRILGVSLGTIYNRINNGELKSFRVGTVIRIKKSELLNN